MMSKKKATKKNSKKRENIMRYGVHIPPVSSEEDLQKTRFTLVKHEYIEGNSAPILFLPKKIDTLISKIEELGVAAVDIESAHSKYVIRFIEDEKSSGGADLLYDAYVNNPCDHVYFVWSDKYAEYPKSFELIINIAGVIAYPSNVLNSKFDQLTNLIDTNFELKVCSKYVDAVIDAIKRGKKSKLEKLYQFKK